MNRITNFLASASILALAAGAADAAEITGRVTEGTGTIGLEGAIVRILETGQTATAGRDGSFRFSNVPAGEYTLEVSYLGADSQSRQVSLATDASTASASFLLGAEVAVTDNILVVGQRGALTSALNRQRAADGVVTVLSADAIGRLPDENVAEAARRAVGVNVLNDQGEGRFVSIRGIDPNLISTSINGVRVTSPEAGSRQVPLDVIDADVLAGIVIQKSLTPDVDGDTLGGNVEIETLSGLDQDDRLLRLKVAGLYDDNVEDWGYRGSLTFADNFMDGRLGVALSASHQEREFGSDNIEVDGPDYELGEAVAYPEELEFRDYIITRERTSVALNLDYQATPDTRLYLNTLWSDFSDQEYRSRVEYKLGDGDFFDSAENLAVVEATPDDEMEVDRDIKDRLESQEIYTVAAGFESFLGRWTLDGVISYVFAEEEEPDRLDTDFRRNMDFGLYGVNMNDPRVPRVAFPEPTGRAAFYDASGFEFDGAEFLNGVSKDEEFALRFNARYDVDFGNNPGYFQMGAARRDREKSFDAETLVYDGFDGPDFTLDQVAQTLDFPLDDFGPAPNPVAVRDFFNANRAQFELNEFDTLVASNAEDYSFEEDVTAVYAMLGVDVDALRIVAGVRAEFTEYDATGTAVFAAEEDATVGGVTLGEDTVFLSTVTGNNEYEDILPSVNLRYEAADDIIVRAAYYASIGRPEAEQIAPTVVIEQNDDNEVEAAYGNPDLNRQQAHNLDFGVEWYINNDSVLAAGVFYKRIDNFIADAATSNVEVNGVLIDDGSTFVNLSEADLFGLELNYQQVMSFLPEPWDGFIVNANYTFVDSETSYQGRNIDLPRQSRHVANLILGYEKGPIDLRLATTYRDEFIDELNAGGAGVDRIVTEHVQVDFSAKYDVTENVRVFAEFKNIFDEPFAAVIRPGSGLELNSQYEEYGFSGVFGFQLRY